MFIIQASKFVCPNNIKYIKYVESPKFKIRVLETRQIFPLYTHYTLASYQRRQ